MAIVERWPVYRGWNKSECMDSLLEKNDGCREVAVSGGSTAFVYSL